MACPRPDSRATQVYAIPRTTLGRSSRHTRTRGTVGQGPRHPDQKQTLIESRCWYSSSTAVHTVVFGMALHPRTPKARRVLEPLQLHMFDTTIRSTILSTTTTNPPRCRKSCASRSSNSPMRRWSSRLLKCTTRSPRTRKRYVHTMPADSHAHCALPLPSRRACLPALT